MTRKLLLAPQQSLPLDAITQRISVLGRTGSGKSHTGMVIGEEVLERHQQLVVLDPKGDWYGLRSSADGKSAGYEILIMGGEHGDLPLDPGAGAFVADFVVRERVSVILDLSLFESKADENRFATDFADRLYRKNRKALLFVIDESDQFAPQQPMPEERRMLSKFEVICRRGRSRGIGVMLISQRSASIHKGCLSQTEIMLAHQTTAPQDRKAIELWVRGKGTEEQQEQFMSRLPALKTGEAFLWSPSWLNVFKEIKVREKRTYDSSATPKVGVRRRPPKVLAQINLDRIKEHMAATLEKAKQDDPKLLREQISGLQAEIRKRDIELKRLKAAPPPAPVVQKVVQPPKETVRTKVERVEVPVLPKRQQNELEKLVGRCEKIMSRLQSEGMRFDVFCRSIWPDIAQIKNKLLAPPPKAAPPVQPGAATSRFQTQRPNVAAAPRTLPPPPPPPVRKPKPQPVARENGEEGSGEMVVKTGQRRMLQVLASFYPTKLSRAQLGSLSLISPSSGTFSNYISALRQYGLIEIDDDGVTISEAGFTYLNGDYPKHPATMEERLTVWEQALKAGQGRMLRVLVGMGGEPITRAELGEQTAIDPGSGTFSNYISELKRNGLVDVLEKSRVRASSAFYVEKT